MNKDSTIYVAGHTGMVGSAIVRKLKGKGFNNLVLKTSKEYDLCNQISTFRFFREEEPEYVILAAARVGGIGDNIAKQADFLWQNLYIQTNVMLAAHAYKATKLLFLSSSCVYPKDCEQPMREEMIMSGKCEPTNEGYAIAKITGMKLCEKKNEQYGSNFISCIPTNIYGVRDHFDTDKAHVIPSLISKIHKAKVNNEEYVEIWGSGNARREFMYVDDLADACITLMQDYNDKEPINIGAGVDISIKDLAHKIKEVIGYEGKLVFNSKYPEGMKQKLLDVSKQKTLGIKPKIGLDEGLSETYKYYLENYGND